MQGYLLKEFQELIETPNRINTLRDEFLRQAFELSKVNKNEDDAECFIGDDLVDINGWILNSLHVNDTIIAIDTLLLSMWDIKQKEGYITTTLSIINGLLSKLKERKDLSKYTCIEESLVEIKSSIYSKYSIHLPLNLSTKETLAKPTHKIQWLGKTNVLVTLFYDLLNGQDKGEPLINYPKDELKQFIASSFLDKDGNELSQATIDTIFTPSKGDKRSKIGDRIELPNKRVIK